MKTEYRLAAQEEIPALRELWREAFGDPEPFLDQFFSVAFSESRCAVADSGGVPVGMTFWFPCTCRGQRMAYLYAVATRKDLRGQGICTGLLTWVRDCLSARGVAGMLLVPETGALARFYGAMGYRPCCPQGRIRASASGPAVLLKPVSPRRYGELRPALLPAGAVLQEGCSLEFQASCSRLYCGKELLLSARVQEDGTLLAQELLCRDPVAAAPGILKALKVPSGIFRVPYGKGRPFAMFLPREGWSGPAPAYFAFAFD